MLKGSAAVLTHQAGRREQKEAPGLTSWPLRQPRALLRHTLLLEREATSRGETSGAGIKGGLTAPLPFMSIGKGFHKVPEPRTNPWTNDSEMREAGEKGEKGVLGLENPTMAKEEDRTEG